MAPHFILTALEQMLQTLGVGGKESELNSIYKVGNKEKENVKLPYRERSINSQNIHTEKKSIQPKTQNLLSPGKANFQTRSSSPCKKVCPGRKDNEQTDRNS